MKILKNTFKKKVKSKYGNFDFEPDEGFELRVYVDYESKLLVIEESPLKIKSGKLYLPIQYIIDPKSGKHLNYNQYKKYFNYDPCEITSNDNQYLLKYQRKHDSETKRDYKTEKLINIKSGKTIRQSESVAFHSEKQENLLEHHLKDLIDGKKTKERVAIQRIKQPQFCSNCNQPVNYSSRYPKYICQDCVKLLTDKDGRKVAFYNTELLGYGCQGYYIDVEPHEEFDSTTCFIQDTMFFAQEARFGGIVIQKMV